MNGKNPPLDIAENFNTIIKPELDRRVQLIASSVIGSFLSGDNPQTTSFRHVINRVMVLTQMPMCFVLFKKEGDKFIEGVTFNHSSRNKAEVRKCIEAVQDGENWRGLFNLFGLDFYLLIIAVGKQKGDYLFETLHPPIEKLPESIPKTARELAAYQLKKVFEANLYASYGAYFRKKLLQPCLDDAWAFSMQEKAAATPADVDANATEHTIDATDKKNILYELERNFKTRLMSNKDSDVVFGLQANGYLDRIFKKIHRNLNEVSAMGEGHLPEENLPANYVLFLRDYAKGKDYKRHFGLCNYSIRIALCDRQKKEFEVRFRSLYETCTTKSEEDRLQYFSTFDTAYANDGLQDLAKDLDREFWRRLRENTQKGTDFSYFIKIMESYFGDQSRSIADAVFADGVLFFRRPFADGGIGRCFESTALESGATYPKTLAEVEQDSKKWAGIGDDLIRLVIGFYWYQGMVRHDSDDNYELGIMLSPVEIGNRIWCVVGYFTSLYKVKLNDDGRDRGVLNLVANTTAWNKNFHIFQEVSVRVKRELRHSLANCYKDMAAWYYAKITNSGSWGEIYGEAKTNQEKRLRLERWINKRLHLLSAYFSYDEIVLEIREGRGAPGILDQGGDQGANKVRGVAPSNKDTKAGIYLSNNTHCAILEGKRNLFFPNAPTSLSKKNETTHSFVNERDVQVELTSAFIQQMWQDAIDGADDDKVSSN